MNYWQISSDEWTQLGEIQNNDRKTYVTEDCDTVPFTLFMFLKITVYGIFLKKNAILYYKVIMIKVTCNLFNI